MADDPKTVTLSAEEAANHRRAYDLLNKVYRDPAHHANLVAALKAADPNVPLPDPPSEVRVRPLEERVTQISESVEKLTKAWQEDAESRKNAGQDAELTARLREAKERFKLNDEGMKLVTDRMIAQGSGDAMAAAALVAADNPMPKPMPSSGMPRAANLFGIRGSEDENLKLLHTDPEAWQTREFERIFAEANPA